MTAPKRREHQPDPFVRAVDRYRARGWNLPCDCPCHWWRGVTEAIACCQMQGMAYIASEGTYMPWPDPEQP
jgi:hypothetical protein